MPDNNELNQSEYNSKIEKYIEGQNSEKDLNFDDESKFQSSNIISSKLDKYLGDDDEIEGENINYCSVCGKELKKFNYGDKCDDCIKKISMVDDIKLLLDYVSPSEELNKNMLLDAGLDELKLNIIISNLLNEKLILLRSNGIYLTDVKSLNIFLRKYGSDYDILDESLYKKSFSSDVVDIEEYSDLVKILFNQKNNKWQVNFYRDGKSILRKFFVTIFDANNHAIRYLSQMGELNNFHEVKSNNQKVKYKKSSHEFVFFSVNRNKWYVKVKGNVSHKFVGFYDTEEEAVIARDNYIKKKRENQAKLRPKKFIKNESDAIVSFNDKANQWVVKVRKKSGGFKKLGYFDTEEEAISAKNEYYGINNEVEDNFDSKFSKGDKVQVISGRFELDMGIIQGFFEEKDAYIVKLENSNISFPVFLKADQLKLI